MDIKVRRRLLISARVRRPSPDSSRLCKMGKPISRYFFIQKEGCCGTYQVFSLRYDDDEDEILLIISFDRADYWECKISEILTKFARRRCLLPQEDLKLWMKLQRFFLESSVFDVMSAQAVGQLDTAL